MKLKRTFITTAGVLVAGLMAHSAIADVVKIGVLAPVSGKAAADGEEMVNGALMAVEELNAGGGGVSGILSNDRVWGYLTWFSIESGPVRV